MVPTLNEYHSLRGTPILDWMQQTEISEELHSPGQHAMFQGCSPMLMETWKPRHNRNCEKCTHSGVKAIHTADMTNPRRGEMYLHAVQIFWHSFRPSHLVMRRSMSRLSLPDNKHRRIKAGKSSTARSGQLHRYTHVEYPCRLTLWATLLSLVERRGYVFSICSFHNLKQFLSLITHSNLHSCFVDSYRILNKCSPYPGVRLGFLVSHPLLDAWHGHNPKLGWGKPNCGPSCRYPTLLRTE